MVRERKSDNYTVGIVGYTNAGKSTRFNALTAGGAYADDRLFATLVTRTRDWDLGGGLKVMLSDTVGFVRDLPHHLVASFRATLEEAIHADLLLIVLDVSDPAAEMHYDTVMKTLDELLDDVAAAWAREEAEPGEWGTVAGKREAANMPRPERVLLLNKVDRLTDNRNLLVWQRKAPGAIPIVAREMGGPDGLGRAELFDVVRRAAQGGVLEVTLRLATKDSKAVNLVENRAEVLERNYEDGAVVMRVRIGQRQLAQLRSVTGRAVEVVGEGVRR
jgi:GTP-binding protein HflX